jgi:hypothetical protein
MLVPSQLDSTPVGSSSKPLHLCALPRSFTCGHFISVVPASQLDHQSPHTPHATNTIVTVQELARLRVWSARSDSANGFPQLLLDDPNPPNRQAEVAQVDPMARWNHALHGDCVLHTLCTMPATSTPTPRDSFVQPTPTALASAPLPNRAIPNSAQLTCSPGNSSCSAARPSPAGCSPWPA